jgi:hypothetical protein
MIALAYDIRPNLDHIPKRPKRGEVATFDAILFPEGCIKNWDLINISTYNGPEPIIFLGWIERLSKTDFPRNIPGLPIISKRMLEVLLSVGDFPHRVISTRIFPYELRYTGDTGEHWNPENLPIDLCNQDYVVVQLLEYTNATDYDRSTFRIHPAFPDDPPVVDQLVLRCPPSGFPPLFRVDSSRLKLFISPSAKIALEEEKIVLNYVEWNENGTNEIVYKLPDNSELYN